MSTALPTKGQEPKRRRGHLRVAAIMQAGVEVFTAKGYDAATMAEIAARSGTATASLYRFFPSKEALADALLLQYVNHALEGLAALRERAGDLTPEQLAQALVDFRLSQQSRRGLAIDLIDARSGTGDRRKAFRSAVLAAMADTLEAAVPSLTRAKAEAMAFMLLHTLKGLTRIEEEEPATRPRLLAEVKELIGTYLASAQRVAAA